MTQHTPQDSQSDAEKIVNEILRRHDHQQDAHELDVSLIEAYVTTRVKEAEAEEVEMAADFAEDVLQQFGYNGKSGGLSTLEWAEGIIKRHKKLQALTTTTNGKGE